MADATPAGTTASSKLELPAHWLITGASSGLGRHLVERALTEGDHVIATVRREGTLDDLVDAHGARLVVERLDVSDADELAGFLHRILEGHQRIDVVVNNAGYSAMGAAEELSDDQIQHQLDTLLVAPIRITRAFLGHMRARGNGRIIQMSSMGGQCAYPGGSAYHTAKWGLEGFTESVSKEMAEFGIRCTIVEPGATRTGFGSNMVFATALPDYADSAAGHMRQFAATADDRVYVGDPAKLAQAIFATTRAVEPPLRLTLGQDAYDTIHDVLTERLQLLEQQEDLARAVLFD
jgi:NAD(P)-dependent dehydrogenase (short-subunit alcohol dehydrogenase family)